jgi:hypothetical protein
MRGCPRKPRTRCEARQQTYALAAGPMMVGDPKLRCVNNQPPVTVRRYVSIRLGHICSAPYVRWRTCVDATRLGNQMDTHAVKPSRSHA